MSVPGPTLRGSRAGQPGMRRAGERERVRGELAGVRPGGGWFRRTSGESVPPPPAAPAPALPAASDPAPRTAPAPLPLTGAEERSRTLSLIDFLADYDARRNPPVYDIRKYGLFLLRDTDLPGVAGVRLTPGEDAWLSVDFLDLPPRPEVPEDLAGLLGDSSTIRAEVRPEVPEPSGGNGPGEPEAAVDPALAAAAGRWITDVWEPFAARWAEVTAAKTLHRDLFQQRERLAMDRESVELVWGFGRLRWQHDGELIDHPLLCIPVEVEQDDVSQRIQVRPAGAPEVEARCLAGLTLADRARFLSIRQSVNDEGADLWDASLLQGLLRPLIRAIDHEGTLAGQAPPPADTGAAVADGSWVLFMRRKLPDYPGFLERMRALYRDESVAVPATLQAIVTDAPSALASQALARRRRRRSTTRNRCSFRCPRMRSSSASWPRPSTAPASPCRARRGPASHTRSPTSSVTTSRTGNGCWSSPRRNRRCGP